MLISLDEILRAYGKKPTGLIHCGGHLGQEAPSYVAAGIEHVVWIEANPALIKPLRSRVEPLGHRVIEAVLDSVDGVERTFHLAEADNGSNRGMSSSLLELGYHKQAHPEVSYHGEIQVVTTTLDLIINRLEEEEWPGFNGSLMIESDTQGMDLDIFRGGTDALSLAEIVYLEVNIDFVYENNGRLCDLDPFMNEHGFECMKVLLAGCQKRDCSDLGNRWCAWGDAAYVKVADPRPASATFPSLWSSWYS